MNTLSCDQCKAVAPTSGKYGDAPAGWGKIIIYELESACEDAFRTEKLTHSEDLCPNCMTERKKLLGVEE